MYFLQRSFEIYSFGEIVLESVSYYDKNFPSSNQYGNNNKLIELGCRYMNIEEWRRRGCRSEITKRCVCVCVIVYICHRIPFAVLQRGRYIYLTLKSLFRKQQISSFRRPYKLKVHFHQFYGKYEKARFGLSMYVAYSTTR